MNRSVEQAIERLRRSDKALHEFSPDLAEDVSTLIEATEVYYHDSLIQTDRADANASLINELQSKINYA